MPESPNKKLDGVFSCKVWSENTEIDSGFGLVSFKVNREVNKIGKAQLVFEISDSSDSSLMESEKTVFNVENTILLQAGYGVTLEDVFEGIVIEHNIEIDAENNATLTVECREPAYLATQRRESTLFTSMKDDAIIKEVLEKHRLSVTCDKTETKHEQLKQHNTTAWDFALNRANVNGLHVVCDGSAVSAEKPKVSEELNITLTNEEDVIEFKAKINTINQFTTVIAQSWDYATGQPIEATSVTPELNEQGSNKDKAQDKPFYIKTSAPVEMTELQSMADAKALEMGLSRILGSCKFCGSTAVKIGKVLELNGFGERFDGKTYVGKLDHELNEAGWTTTVHLGLTSSSTSASSPTSSSGSGTSSESKPVMAPPAGGILPGIHGLHIGVVKTLEGDPNGQYRIEVEIPGIEGDKKKCWARLCTFWGNNGYGSFFIPDIEQTVVLGFFDSNPCHPVILGTLQSSQQKPAYEYTADNNIQALVTKEKLKLEFDDKDKIITLETPGKNKIVISDKDKGIEITDENKNKITLHDKGITIESADKLILKAKGDVQIEAGGALKMKATNDAKLEGVNIEAKASAQATVKGAMAELSASGNTTVKGGMVMIN